MALNILNNLRYAGFVFLFIPLLAAGQTIKHIEYEGLKKTKPGFLAEITELHTDVKIDSAHIENEIQYLRNIQLFSDVQYKLESDTLRIILTENLSVFPLINIGGIKENFWFLVGVADNNFAGNGIQLGGFYQYYDRHSVQLYLAAPYLFSSEWGITANVLKRSTLEPVFFDSTVVSYLYDLYLLEAAALYHINRKNTVSAGGAYLFEKYAIEKDELFPTLPDSLSVDKYLFKTIYTANYIDFFNQFIAGFKNQFFFEQVFANYNGSFWKVLNETTYYKRVGAGGNFASRLRLGTAKNIETPFAPFVLDSYINIRGSGNRIARGTSEIVLNTEYRQTIFEKPIGYVQAVVFSDMGSWQPEGTEYKELFNVENYRWFLGGGMRVGYKKNYNTVLRIDFGVDAFDVNKNGFVLGFGQYF
ncbi:MAG: hypothetical protein ACKVPJ_09915 [Chitinophagales bacterium]